MTATFSNDPCRGSILTYWVHQLQSCPLVCSSEHDNYQFLCVSYFWKPLNFFSTSYLQKIEKRGVKDRAQCSTTLPVGIFVHWSATLSFTCVLLFVVVLFLHTFLVILVYPLSFLYQGITSCDARSREQRSKLSQYELMILVVLLIKLNWSQILSSCMKKLYMLLENVTRCFVYYSFISLCVDAGSRPKTTIFPNSLRASKLMLYILSGKSCWVEPHFIFFVYLICLYIYISSSSSFFISVCIVVKLFLKFPILTIISSLSL